MKITKLELKQIIKEEIKLLLEITTWTDIERKLPNNFPDIIDKHGGPSPILTGHFIKHNRTNKVFKIIDTDEKFIHINKRLDPKKYSVSTAHPNIIAVGDGLIYTNDWTLLDKNKTPIKIK